VVTARPANRTRLFVALAVLSITQLVSVAHGAPVPNLVLTCSDERAIGQAQSACHGTWAYRIPTDPLIVSSGSSYVWRVLGDLIGADTVLVCTLPVEPGQYSSCRDASGVRRMALVRKDSIMAGGSVTVDKTGADYTDPVTAAQNAFAGDTWCVAPQPDQPCVMAIGEGVFILRETLGIGGLVVAGAGKGATLLVADNGVETAVSGGNARLSDLTIVNSQPGGAQATGMRASGTVQLHDAAIHVSGAARNLAIGKRSVVSLEILDSEITAAGQDSTGIETLVPSEPNAVMTVERSLVSAAGTALDETETDIGPTVRLIDSRISGNIDYGPESTLLDIVRTEVVGNVSAANDSIRVRITGSYIKGVVGAGGQMSGHDVDITDTTVEGVVIADHGSGTFTFDGLHLLGELRLGTARVQILRSHISSLSNAAALSLGAGAFDVQLEQTFVQGALAVAVAAGSKLQSSSSVLAGPISASPTAVLSCADTYGADYELLTALCQPQPP
jgi:hypothetical protein